MNYTEKWIWLPKELYPKRQTTKYSGFLKEQSESYTVAEFKRTFAFDKLVKSAHLRFSGDTEFRLYLNDRFLATGPATVEGDFIGNENPRPSFYAMEAEVFPDSDTLDFFARVKLMPVKICEYSKGHGGFMLTAHITFEDGTKTVITTDKSWQVRFNGAYTAPYKYDGRIAPDAFVNAEETDNIWHTKTAPLRIRDEHEILPGSNSLTVKPRETTEKVIEFDMIYAGFIHLSVKTKGLLEIELICRETEESGSREEFIFDRDDEYTGLQLHSAGKLVLRAQNCSDSPAEITASLIATHYPADKEAKTVTDDKELNKVLEVCAHTLKYCRQLHHLDSPRHCEPLACTGDYYIESLMTAFSFGDMTLAEFDIIRTAELIRNNDGRMFHTTYSLIWVRMLRDIYMITGNLQLLKDCEDALIMLLNRFESYIGENGIIETPPDYMFIDWIYIDGLSMHHPPKALGQTCLNMFYYEALKAASDVFGEISEIEMAQKYLRQRTALGENINKLLYDAEKGLYFEGLNTKTPEDMLYMYLSQNTDKRYYLKHSNILAAYCGVCGKETAKNIIEKIMSDECPGDYQPYFAHFLLEAIFRNGLRDKYTLKVLEKWKKPISECSKGLVEGFIPPEPTYSFDHSHAWGGTPLYSLPKAIMGLELLKPGLKELRISPSLLGLKEATAVLPTPYGDVICKLKEGEKPVITHPEEIIIH